MDIWSEQSLLCCLNADISVGHLATGLMEHNAKLTDVAIRNISGDVRGYSRLKSRPHMLFALDCRCLTRLCR